MEHSSKKEIPAFVWVLLPLVIAGLVFGYFRFLSPGNLTEFAKCLTEKKTVFYGSKTCPHCKAQIRDFGRAFEYIKYVECNIDQPGKQADICDEAGVTGYPTWIFDGKDPVSGRQDLRILADKTSCALPDGVVQTGEDIVRPTSTGGEVPVTSVTTDAPSSE
ncbi:MAG: hypothetical protein A2V81_01835 [Candidatus Abawacabacteria bacterium RBG_16_42_10]|uniref:Thioredoxin domain-containing protein n=1 Tax=Candidatus Abawacabacteria bacterium RBG_16_42_10 TaxID=1817814 RepID=A0A1F4XKW8_9BACT|nr:MAG: hypothetical protein A2V81_01835 [Candidatus Abawacabacteria bacterium RBG_16_42_10]